MSLTVKLILYLVAKWTDKILKEDITKLEEHEIIDNISAIKVYSRALQERIHHLGNKLKTNIALFDLVLKEKNVISGKINEIKNGELDNSQVCQKTKEISDFGKMANLAMKEEVKSVIHEINRVHTSVNKLSEDEKNQKKIIHSKKSKNKIILEGQYFNKKKKEGINNTQDNNINKVAENAQKLKHNSIKSNETVKNINNRKNIIKAEKKEKDIKKFMKISNVIDKKLIKISNNLDAVNAQINVKTNNHQLNSITKVINKTLKSVSTIPNQLSPQVEKHKLDLIKKMKDISEKTQQIKKSNNGVIAKNDNQSKSSNNKDLKENIRSFFLNNLAEKTKHKHLDKLYFNKIYNLFMHDNNIKSLSRLDEEKRRNRIINFINDFLKQFKNKHKRN